MKLKIYIAFLILFSANLKAQDLHFSQFYMSPLTLNPALTGVFNGNYRLTGNYRNQWQSILPTTPFRTFAGSVELSGKSGRYNRIGLGFHFYSDQAGSLSLSKTQFTGSLGYLIALSRNRDYYIAAGLQASVNQASVNYLAVTTGSQWDGVRYNPNNITGETFGGRNVSYADAAAGIMWYHYRSARSYQYVGGSIFHVNRPNISFVDNSLDRLYTKYVLHAGAGIKVKPKFDFTPYLLTMFQGPAFEVTTGTFFKFILDEVKTSAYGGTSFYVGPFYRIVGDDTKGISGDAIILASKVDFDQFTLGLSYDINLSGLSPATSGRGGPELSVQYIGAFKNKSSKSFCPKF
jgi:type IX secretion system PorP/SprF family membrane protein